MVVEMDAEKLNQDSPQAKGKGGVLQGQSE
jgi:hypothetical protein